MSGDASDCQSTPRNNEWNSPPPRKIKKVQVPKQKNILKLTWLKKFPSNWQAPKHNRCFTTMDFYSSAASPPSLRPVHLHPRHLRHLRLSLETPGKARFFAKSSATRTLSEMLSGKGGHDFSGSWTELPKSWLSSPDFLEKSSANYWCGLWMKSLGGLQLWSFKKIQIYGRLPKGNSSPKPLDSAW